MPHYCLIQRQDLQTHVPEGEPLTHIGFLDFLREVQGERLGLTPFQHVCVEGLEDVLLAARPKVQDVANTIRRILQHHAERLDRELSANVYVTFRNPLEKGETLWVNMPAEPRLPVHLIFGSPAREELVSKPFFRVSFNLSSGR